MEGHYFVIKSKLAHFNILNPMVLCTNVGVESLVTISLSSVYLKMFTKCMTVSTCRSTVTAIIVAQNEINKTKIGSFDLIFVWNR